MSLPTQNGGLMTVLQQQCLLTFIGYPCAVDGIPGDETTAQTKAFQRDYSLDADGIWGAMTEKMAIGVVAGTVARKEKQAISDNVSDKTSIQTNTLVQDAPDWWGEIEHFSPEEKYITCPCFRCRGKKLYPEKRLMIEADHIRDLAKKPMIPSSVRRCQEHNDELPGSAKNSLHIAGLAMDFDIPALPDSEIKSILEAEKAVGRVRYWYQMANGNFHFDVN